MRLDELDKKITQSDLDALEIFADRIFGKVGIDVEFTRHFLDRVNDDRNGEQITGSELTRLFKQEYKKWGKPIAQMGPDAEAVMKDLQTDINMPFALRWDRDNNELDLIVKTVMRKKDFKTSNKEFPVESLDDEELSEWNWRQPFSFPRPDVVGKPLPSKDSYGREDVKTIELPIGLAPGKLNASKKSKRNEEVNEDSQIWEWNKEDPNNPEVLIQGYGRLMLNQIEDSVVRKLAELTKMAERGDFEQIQSLLDRDVMQTMMKAIVDTKAELQATRKRGGPKSRGINKESIFDALADDMAEKFEAVKKSVTEYGVGKIVPGINTTVDVGPDEIKKQAAKFGNAVDKDGVPKKNLR